MPPSDYPPLGDIVGSVALTFFAFLGFGVITFTAAQLVDPPRQLPRAVYLALGIATVIYVAVSLGVFGTLTVQEVIDSGGTALAVAAEPVLGQAGYWLMTVTALFATAGATNAGLYPGGRPERAPRVDRPVPAGAGAPIRRTGARPGSLVTAVIAIVLAVGFDLNAIASIGSAVALMIFTLIGVGHLRIRDETGASGVILVLGILAAAVVLLLFLPDAGRRSRRRSSRSSYIVLQSIVLDLIWKRVRGEPPAEPIPPRPSRSPARPSRRPAGR